MLRQVTLFVIVGTFLMGTYYVVDATYVQPTQRDALQTGLDQFQDGLTYIKLLQLDEQLRSQLLRSMPSDTRMLVMEEAAKHPTFSSETLDDIRALTGSDVRILRTATIDGLKGHDASGTVSLVESGSKMFLRLDGFSVTPSIDLEVYLTKDGSVDTGVEIGSLKATAGSQNYEITGISADTYNVMVVYSAAFEEYYAFAKIPKA